MLSPVLRTHWPLRTFIAIRSRYFMFAFSLIYMSTMYKKTIVILKKYMLIFQQVNHFEAFKAQNSGLKIFLPVCVYASC